MSSSILQHHQGAETSLSQARMDPTGTHSGPSRDASAFSLSTLHFWGCTLLTRLVCVGGLVLKSFIAERTEQPPEIRATRIVGREPCMDYRVWKTMST